MRYCYFFIILRYLFIVDRCFLRRNWRLLLKIVRLVTVFIGVRSLENREIVVRDIRYVNQLFVVFGRRFLGGSFRFWVFECQGVRRGFPWRFFLRWIFLGNCTCLSAFYYLIIILYYILVLLLCCCVLYNK